MIKKLESWFKERPLWLQDAAGRLLRNSEISPADIDQLTLLCKKDAGIDVEIDSIPQALEIPEGALTYETALLDLRLVAIKELQGINALAPRKPLEFGNENLTIIYGSTGSGKSGYVRILKHACGARHIGKILSNVYKESPASQGCKFIYTVNGKSEESAWLTTDGVLPTLSSIKIYDSDCGEIYVNEENEVAYEPRLLSFLQKLVEISDKVWHKIDVEIVRQASKKPVMLQNHMNTEAWKWYSNLNHQTSKEEIQKWRSWTDEDEKSLTALKVRLSEPDPKDKAALLRKQKGNLSTLASDLQMFLDLLSPDNCSAYIAAKKDTQAKRQVASVDALRVFEKSPVTGIGSESWRLLWEQARAFSMEEAYKEIPFPNTAEGSHCVLCQQPLEETAKVRLRSFEEFVKGGIAKAAEKAELKLSELQKQINNIPTEDNVVLRLDSGGLTEELLRKQVLALRTGIEQRRTALITSDEPGKFKEPIDKGIIDSINIFAASLEEQAVIFDNDANQGNRKELQEKLTRIEARKWLSEQSESIEREIIRLKCVKQLEDAKKLTSTYALSLKKSALADELITSAFVKRFDEEIKKLGAESIGVVLEKTRTDKGRVYHQVKIKNNNSGVPSAQILSEGEFRIISLAAFLADTEFGQSEVEGHQSKSTFIFDDPISSLDQEYEEAMAKRVVKLSGARQVIVFTHRLSLLASLEDAAKTNGVSLNVIGLQREPWGAGEPREAPLPAQKPKNAINALLDRVVGARKILTESGQSEYELIAKGICSDIRITLERLIENDLLADVIQRFRRPITTQGKLHKLAKITLEDCKFIDDLMTKYSQYEHSQPNESPIPLPNPDNLEEDLKKLKLWREEFEKR